MSSSDWKKITNVVIAIVVLGIATYALVSLLGHETKPAFEINRLKTELNNIPVPPSTTFMPGTRWENARRITLGLGGSYVSQMPASEIEKHYRQALAMQG